MMNHTHFFFAVITLLGLACGTAGTDPGKASGTGAGNSKCTFKFSDRPAASMVTDPNNWCAGNFGEAALVSPDKTNPNRRLFALSNLPNRVAINYGHITASFMLWHQGNQVWVSTSDNLPVCLSRKEYFSISEDGTSFHYNNGMQVNFDVLLQEFPNGIQVAVDLPEEAGFGLLVNRCLSCK